MKPRSDHRLTVLHCAVILYFTTASCEMWNLTLLLLLPRLNTACDVDYEDGFGSKG